MNADSSNDVPHRNNIGSRPSIPIPNYISDVIHDVPQTFRSIIEFENGPEEEHIEHFKYKQDLDRKLSVSSIIGLGFSLMGVPFGISSTLWIPLILGGNVTILYGWIISAVFSTCVVLSLSEVISKYPTSGGVYHFSALLSNDKYSLISSWFTGWFLLIGSWTYTVSVVFSGSQFILSVFGLKNAYYKEDIFYVLGIFFLLLSFVGFVNFKLANHLEFINKMCIIWSIGSVLLIDILLIVFAKRTNSIKTILTNFDNSRSGWQDPMAFLIGLQGSTFSITGYGMIFSMTDEVKRPERNMPKGAISSICILGIFGLFFILPILVILPELTLLLDDNPELMPIELVFKIATESYVVSFLLVLLLIGTVIFQAIGSFTTASRTTYAFARDGGLPYKHLFIGVERTGEGSTSNKIPRNALFLSMVVCGILSLLSLLSASAFNAFMGASVISLSLANGIPILCLMLNKRKKIKGAAFRLKWISGWVINSVSVFWVLLSSIILCLPVIIKNLNADTMNYAVLVFLAFTGLAAVGFKLWGVSSFEGPKIDTDYFELSNVSQNARPEDFVIGIDDQDEEDYGDDFSMNTNVTKSTKKKKVHWDEAGGSEGMGVGTSELAEDQHADEETLIEK